ncbi:hypothetical protein LEP1GSC047_0303 [Leptospira inadai serovar Lyme str. 10]|uniref:Uncharacterized protein n=2 Tax=Leptospira inadai serovar Lyme TaxID=293084 RepID=V6H9J6_9LEPT|nr:hypothetical protein [Leptospira inadai]EQA35836.1 hypothetical protein LEP1GSC047_0303 [Leptospira inadai serovar Lyme str. 10]PNV76802.1 hypothetical protein BES34_000490 [Leptospira inadai serovar Lyme]
MKRFGILFLATFLSVIFVSDILGQDSTGGKVRVLQKKIKVREYTEIVSQRHTYLSSGEDDKGLIFGTRSQFLYGADHHSDYGSRIHEPILIRHTLSYHYLFLPPPA